MDRLSTLIANLNEVFGKDLGEADKIWIEQQRITVMADPEMRSIAQENDKTQYEVALEAKIKDLVVERHESNGALFDAFYKNPRTSRRHSTGAAELVCCSDNGGIQPTAENETIPNRC